MGPHVNNVAWAEAYLCTKWHLDPTSRLATTDIGPKFGEEAVPLWGGELGPHLTQCGRGLPRVKFHLDPSNHLATIDQCYKQTGQAFRQWPIDRANRFTNGRPKMNEVPVYC